MINWTVYTCKICYFTVVVLFLYSNLCNTVSLYVVTFWNVALKSNFLKFQVLDLKLCVQWLTSTKLISHFCNGNLLLWWSIVLVTYVYVYKLSSSERFDQSFNMFNLKYICCLERDKVLPREHKVSLRTATTFWSPLVDLLLLLF